MTEPVRRRPDVVSWVLLATGGVLTFFFFSSVRPWGDSPVNALFLVGPVVLLAAVARLIARSGSRGRSGGPARMVVAAGVMMLLVGGCPWLYTPLITGDNDEASGMLGTILFLLIGLPGVAVTAVGAVAVRRRAQTLPAETAGIDEAVQAG